MEIREDEFSSFLKNFKEKIQRCFIENFHFDSCEERYIEMFSSFLKGLKVIDRVLCVQEPADWYVSLLLKHLEKLAKSGVGSD